MSELYETIDYLKLKQFPLTTVEQVQLENRALEKGSNLLGIALIVVCLGVSIYLVRQMDKEKKKEETY